MDVRSHSQDSVWYRVLLVTQHAIVDSSMHSTLMCEVEHNIVEGGCVRFQSKVPCVEKYDTVTHGEDMAFPFLTLGIRMIVRPCSIRPSGNK